MLQKGVKTSWCSWRDLVTTLRAVGTVSAEGCVTSWDLSESHWAELEILQRNCSTWGAESAVRSGLSSELFVFLHSLCCAQQGWPKLCQWNWTTAWEMQSSASKRHWEPAQSWVREGACLKCEAAALGQKELLVFQSLSAPVRDYTLK